MKADAGHPHLLALIRGEIQAEGRITFERFMELALYDPEYGYYSRSVPIGPEGDYYTSPDVTPLFGATIGRQLHEMWLTLGRPDPFTLVEFGAGKGLLGADILGWAGAARPDFFSSLDYVIVELSPGLRRIQRETLLQLPVRWADMDSFAPSPVVGCTLSNEVADALPFHRVQRTGGKLRELWVIERGEQLMEELGEPSSPLIEDYVESVGVELVEGQVAEINLQAQEWMRSQIDKLTAGFALTIDYGDIAAVVYASSRLQGSVRCYYKHTLNRNPFLRVGSQDITGDVNFSGLARAIESVGAIVTGYTSQAYFLTALGLGEALIALYSKATMAHEFETERAAVAELIRPDGLGNFKVLVAHKNVDEPKLTGLSFGSYSV